jgi:AcrR family transcriptional regulator
MPKTVDHDERRKDLADAVLAIIARTGINGVTVRAVAQEAGWSTGVLTHYFGNRHEMMLGALRRAAAVTGRRQAEVVRRAERDAVTTLETILDEVLPLDAERLALTRIFLFFYAEAAAEDAVRQEIGGYLANWRRFVEETVRRAQADGALHPSHDPADAADALVALTDGMAVHALFDDRLLADLRAGSPVPAWIAAYRAPAATRRAPVS